MKFLCLYKPSKPEGTPPTQREMDEMGKLIEEGMKSGSLLATEGCLPSAKGARVRLSGGKYTVTDGPFTESKEQLLGFYVMDCADRDAAISAARELRQVNPSAMYEIRPILLYRPGLPFPLTEQA